MVSTAFNFLPIPWGDATESAGHAPTICIPLPPLLRRECFMVIWKLTCLNELHKTCRIPRCFEGCPPILAADTVLARLGGKRSLGRPGPKRIVA